MSNKQETSVEVSSASGLDPIVLIEKIFKLRDSAGNLLSCDLTGFQKDFLRAGPLYGNRNLRIMNKSRKLGYSMLLMIEDLLVAGLIYDHVFIPYTATTEDQAIRSLQMCRQMAEDARLEGKRVDFGIVNDSTWSIKFGNSSAIQAFAGSNPSGIRGPNAFCGQLDEFAFNPNQKELLEAYTPMFVQGGQLTVVSTPRGVNNEYWRMHSRAEELGYIALTQPVFKDVSKFNVNRSILEQLNEGLELVAPWISPQILETDRMRDATSFLQEYCCQAAEASYTLFPRERIALAVQKDVPFEYGVGILPKDKNQGPVFTGHDFALSTLQSADFSVSAIGRWEDDNTLRIVCLERIKGMGTPEQVEGIEGTFRAYKPVSMYLEDNTFGKSIFQYLQRTVPVVEPFHTGAASKQSLIRQMQEFFANKKIKINGGSTFDEKKLVDQWVEEFTAFAKIENRLGTGYKLEGAGQHDDCVMATGFLVQAVIDWMGVGYSSAPSAAPKDWGPSNIEPIKQRQRDKGSAFITAVARGRGYEEYLTSKRRGGFGA